MKTKIQPVLTGMLCAVGMAALIGCAENRPMTATNSISALAAVSQPAVEPAQAKDLLMNMAEFLAKSPSFSVNLESSYEVLQESGQMIEFGENRRIVVRRPNGLRVEIEHSDGERHLVQYDGNDITTSSPTHNVYAQIVKPGGIDEAVMYFLRDLGMRLPLAMLLVSRLPEELERRTLALDYVEKTVVDGTPTHHLAGRTETVDYQVWIAEGARPLPLRIVLSYKNEEGHPSFRAQFFDWNLMPEIQDSLFTFNPTDGMRKIAFAAELNKIALEDSIRPEESGGKQ